MSEQEDFKVTGEAELKDRKYEAGLTAEFGITYLDDALNGIRRSDLVIIAARTGAGKTELAATLALKNCLSGSKAILIALEAERFEVLRRLKYQMVASVFFARRDQF